MMKLIIFFEYKLKHDKNWGLERVSLFLVIVCVWI